MSDVNAILGRKAGMTQVFDASGKRFGVTVIEVGPCTVLGVRTAEKDGYNGLQLGFVERKEKTASKPIAGHCKKAGTTPKRYIREVRTEGVPTQKLGDVLKADLLNGVKLVDVAGVTKGKGFQGTMKRWNFSGIRQSHGTSKRHRSPGALGRHMSISKGVPKGKRMSGHLGMEALTIRSLELVKVDAENNIILVRGGVPGTIGSLVIVKKALAEKARNAKKKAG